MRDQRLAMSGYLNDLVTFGRYVDPVKAQIPSHDKRLAIALLYADAAPVGGGDASG